MKDGQLTVMVGVKILEISQGIMLEHDIEELLCRLCCPCIAESLLHCCSPFFFPESRGVACHSSFPKLNLIHFLVDSASSLDPFFYSRRLGDSVFLVR